MASSGVTDLRSRSASTASALRDAGLSVGALAAGFAVYKAGTPLSVHEVTGIQLGAGSQPLPLPAGAARDAYWDLALIAGYGASFWSAARLARFWPGGSRAVLVRRGLRGLAVAAVLADVVEDALVVVSARGTLEEADVRSLLDVVRTAALGKFGCFYSASALALLLLVAGPVAAARGTRRAGP